AKAIQALYPLPQVQAVSNNYTAVVPPNSNEKWTHTLKGDHNFNAHHHVSASAVYTSNPMDSAGNGLPYPIGGYLVQPFGYRFIRSTYDWTLSASMLN